MADVTINNLSPITVTSGLLLPVSNGSTTGRVSVANINSLAPVQSVAARTGAVVLTSTDVGLGLVENKSSATIRGEITSSNVTTALGYTPYNGTTNPNGYLNSVPAGGIIKVVSSALTSVYGPGAGGLTFQDIGLNASITPVSTSSKIMIMFTGNGGSNAGTLFSRLVRGSTAICVGDAASGKTQASTPSSFFGDGNHARAHVMNYVDSPNTASVVTYKVQFASNAGNWYINRSPNDYECRYASTLTLMEIKG